MAGKTARKSRASNGARDEVPAGVERTKAPPRKVYADDLTITVDGKDYNPHAGEWVRFAGGMSVGDVKLVVDLQGFQDTQAATGKATQEQIDQLRDFTDKLGEATEFIAARIVSWNWTDEASRPYPECPSATALRGLRFEELMWLLTAGFRAAGSDDARLKGSRRSTTR